MLVEVVGMKLKKKEAIKYILRKMPLMSKVAQFNAVAEDMHVEYVEFKILKYEVTSKTKSNTLFRNGIKQHDVTMLVNTYDGYSESVEMLPDTEKRYVAKSCIKKSRIEDNDIIEGVKDQIIYFLGKKYKNDGVDRLSVQNINIREVKSIYKPYWVANFKGKNIYIDAWKI